MAEFKIEYKGEYRVICTVEAESYDEALEKADDNVNVSGYVGNGGYDKLIGVTDTDEASISIEDCGDLSVCTEDE